MDNNPYAPPSAELETSHDEGEGSFIPNGRTVSAGNGANWIGSGWAMFKQSAGTWIGMIVIWLALIMISSLIPLVNLFNMIFGVLLTSGLMIACHNQRREGSLNIGDLFAGFSEHFVPLLIVGLLGMVGYFVAAIPLFIVMGGAFFALMVGASSEINPALFGIPMLLAMLVFLALLVPVMAAMWFAPALVVISKCSPIEALKRSFFGCLRNWLPFLVWSLLIFVLIIIGMIPLFLGLLVVLPLMWASTYVAFRDIYYAD